ncbi:MAG TPA: ComEC/Rec2 family competence protein [Candidatus Paceibacterota bacterium]|nr:ComEC/Rec2 family competence protein [Candidatus Paceibacterota bacterium]
MNIRIDTRAKTAILGSVAALICFGSWALLMSRASPRYGGESIDDGFLHIYFLDVGQGDAIYIRAPGGKDMLVDSGPNAGILRERLADVMPRSDKRIDIVLETHPDADHISGFPNIFEDFDVGTFVEPGIHSKNSIDDEMHALLAEKGVPIAIARRGDSYDLGSTSFRILFPDEDVSKYKDTNDASIVGQLVYGSTTIMLTGDSPKKVEDKLVRLDKAGLKSDVLKLGHHGSRTSSGAAFVQAVAPAYAIVSAGAGNRYGHPHKEVLDTMKSLGIPVLQTSLEGIIEFQSDGKTIWRN